MEVNLRFDLRFDLRLFHFSFGNTDFFVYMDGHPQATVVLFPCSLLKQGFKKATMRITSCASSLFVCLFLTPWSLARGAVLHKLISALIRANQASSHTGLMGWLSYGLTEMALIRANRDGSDTG